MQLVKSDSVYSINDSVDVYLNTEEGDKCRIVFYFINSRRRFSIISSQSVAVLLSKLNRTHTLKEILKSNEWESHSKEIIHLFEVLLDQKILEEYKNQSLSSHDFELSERYDRQISYLNELNVNDGLTLQKSLEKADITIFGCGAIGGTIALELAMMGIGNITLVDDGRIERKHKARLFFYNENDIGKLKAEILIKRVKQINSLCKVDAATDFISPESNIDSYLNGKSLVINTADEPNIGFTSIKIGRQCWNFNIPLYIAGGFAAHLMSSGEFVIPGTTPCIDCYFRFFSQALQDWRPIYSPINTDMEEINGQYTQYNGGLAQMSLFAASIAVIHICRYLTGYYEVNSYVPIRREYLMDLQSTSIQLDTVKRCDICRL